ENLAILLFFWLALAASGRSSRLLWPLAGASLGLAIASRPELAPFGAASLAWAAWVTGPRPRALLVSVGGLAAGALVTLLLWGGTDAVYPAGLNYYFGNHAGADGVSATAPGFTANPPGGYGDAIALAAKALGRTPSAREADRYWYHEARAYAEREPARV